MIMIGKSKKGLRHVLSKSAQKGIKEWYIFEHKLSVAVVMIDAVYKVTNVEN